MRSVCITLLTCVALASAQARIPELSPQQLRDYTRELEQLQKSFFATEQFGDQFWRESKRVADRTGPNIIPALLDYTLKKKWTGEEGLIFVPLIALLPRRQTVAILRAYQKSSRQAEHIFGREYLIELEADDVQDGVRRFSK